MITLIMAVRNIKHYGTHFFTLVDLLVYVRFAHEDPDNFARSSKQAKGQTSRIKVGQTKYPKHHQF